MKNPMLRCLIVIVLLVQFVLSGVAFASAANISTAVTVSSSASTLTSLKYVVQLLTQVLTLVQQKIALEIPATLIASELNTASTATAIKAPLGTGWIESVTIDGVVTGWAIDGSASNTQSVVAVWVDGVAVGTTSTYVYRPDINATQHVDGKHGFIYVLPTTNKTDASPHHVDVTLVSTGQMLKIAKSIPFSQVFSIPPTLSWSAGVIAAGIPDVEVARGGNKFEIFGNRQFSTSTKGVVTRGVIAVHSLDGGSTWSDVGTIATATANTDIGDGSMTYSTSTATLYFAYRYNQATTLLGLASYFSVRLKQSTDFGQTWTDFGTLSGIVHEQTVAVGEGNGLWTPQVFFNNAGQLMFNYDDQLASDVALQKINGGQFGMLTSWNAQTKMWNPSVVIGQGTTGRVDGVGARTQINLGGGRLWSPVESSVGTLPRSLALRFTESYDDGKTWSLTENALSAKQIVATDWNQGTKDESILYNVPPRGIDSSGMSTWYDWSWPLAVKLKQNPDIQNVGKTSAIFVLFRSDEDLPYVPSGTGNLTSHTVDKNLYYLLSTNGAKSWVKGNATRDIILDHRVIALHDGSLLIGYSLKNTPGGYVVKKGCFTAVCSL